MPLPLQGQIALVTGGAKGFGLGIAQQLHAAGARVWITGRDQTALDSAARTLGVTALRADATSGADWDRAIAAVQQAAGRIDILVNNAGGGVKIAATEEQTDESIAAAISLNFTSAVLGCRRVAPLLRRQGSGIIVNISSVAAHHAWPTWGVYGAAKAALNHFSKSLYLELRPHGVRVVSIYPGKTDTPMLRTLLAEIGKAYQAERYCRPSDIARATVDALLLPRHVEIPEVIIRPFED